MANVDLRDIPVRNSTDISIDASKDVKCSCILLFFPWVKLVGCAISLKIYDVLLNIPGLGYH